MESASLVLLIAALAVVRFSLSASHKSDCTTSPVSTFEPCTPNKFKTCFCSEDKNILIHCNDECYSFFDGRSGESLVCIPKKSKLDNCPEVEWPSNKYHPKCTEIMEKGCVQVKSAGDYSCWCDSLKIKLTMSTYVSNAIHLNIYNGHTGKLLCPTEAKPGECTDCSCANKTTNVQKPEIATTTRPTKPLTSSPAVSDAPQSTGAPTTLTTTDCEITTTSAKNYMEQPKDSLDDEPPLPLPAIIGGCVATGVILIALAVTVVVKRRQRPKVPKEEPIEMDQCENCEENDLYGVVG